MTHAVENELNQPLRFFYMQNFDPHATAEARISDLPPPAPVPAPTLAQGVARGGDAAAARLRVEWRAQERAQRLRSLDFAQLDAEVLNGGVVTAEHFAHDP